DPPQTAGHAWIHDDVPTRITVEAPPRPVTTHRPARRIVPVRGAAHPDERHFEVEDAVVPTQCAEPSSDARDEAPDQSDCRGDRSRRRDAGVHTITCGTCRSYVAENVRSFPVTMFSIPTSQGRDHSGP